jgi:hypothetical protein
MSEAQPYGGAGHGAADDDDDDGSTLVSAVEFESDGVLIDVAAMQESNDLTAEQET